MAREIEKRYGSHGLHANAVHPGNIMTELGRYLPKEMKDGLYVQYASLLKSIPCGAATSVWAACAKEFEGCGGYYLEDCSHSHALDAPVGGSTGYLTRVYDEESARRLYELSLKLVELQN
jgi:hypothetical protein